MNACCSARALVTLLGVLSTVSSHSTRDARNGRSLATFRGGAFARARARFVQLPAPLWQWQYYLGRLGIRGIPVLDSLLVFLSGFVLTITPGKVGEVFKSAVLAKTHGIAVERTASIVIADRLTDVIGIVLLILLGSATFPDGRPWAAAGTAAVLLGLLFILWQKPALWLCERLERQRGKLSRFVPKLRPLCRPARAGQASALLFPTLLSCCLGSRGRGPLVLLAASGGRFVILAVVVYASATLAGR